MLDDGSSIALTMHPQITQMDTESTCHGVAEGEAGSHHRKEKPQKTQIHLAIARRKHEDAKTRSGHQTIATECG